jgi:hypothetical protein
MRLNKDIGSTARAKACEFRHGHIALNRYVFYAAENGYGIANGRDIHPVFSHLLSPLRVIINLLE